MVYQINEDRLILRTQRENPLKNVYRAQYLSKMLPRWLPVRGWLLLKNYPNNKINCRGDAINEKKSSSKLCLSTTILISNGITKNNSSIIVENAFWKIA